MYLSICSFIVLFWPFVGAEQGKMRLLLLRYLSWEACAKQESRGLGLFMRSLVGMDREAAKLAFGQFLAGAACPASYIPSHEHFSWQAPQIGIVFAP
jgi:hypothetical protein